MTSSRWRDNCDFRYHSTSVPCAGYSYTPLVVTTKRMRSPNYQQIPKKRSNKSFPHFLRLTAVSELHHPSFMQPCALGQAVAAATLAMMPAVIKVTIGVLPSLTCKKLAVISEYRLLPQNRRNNEQINLRFSPTVTSATHLFPVDDSGYRNDLNLH